MCCNHQKGGDCGVNPLDRIIFSMTIIKKGRLLELCFNDYHARGMQMGTCQG